MLCDKELKRRCLGRSNLDKKYKCIFRKVGTLLAYAKNKDGALFNLFEIRDLLEFTQINPSFDPRRCNRAQFNKYERMCAKMANKYRNLHAFCLQGVSRLRKYCVTPDDRLYNALVRSELPFYEELLASSKGISQSQCAAQDEPEMNVIECVSSDRVFNDEQRKEFMLQCCDLVSSLKEGLYYFDRHNQFYKHLIDKEEALMLDRCIELREHAKSAPIGGVSCHRQGSPPSPQRHAHRLQTDPSPSPPMSPMSYSGSNSDSDDDDDGDDNDTSDSDVSDTSYDDDASDDYDDDNTPF